MMLSGSVFQPFLDIRSFNIDIDKMFRSFHDSVRKSFLSNRTLYECEKKKVRKNVRRNIKNIKNRILCIVLIFKIKISHFEL